MILSEKHLESVAWFSIVGAPFCAVIVFFPLARDLFQRLELAISISRNVKLEGILGIQSARAGGRTLITIGPEEKAYTVDLSLIREEALIPGDLVIAYVYTATEDGKSWGVREMFRHTEKPSETLGSPCVIPC